MSIRKDFLVTSTLPSWLVDPVNSGNLSFLHSPTHYFPGKTSSMERCAGYLTSPADLRGQDNRRFAYRYPDSSLVFSPMFDVNTILAIINIFLYYLASVPTSVSMANKPTELDGILPEEAIITHPVGEKDRYQTFSLYAKVIVALNTNCSAKVIISMRTESSTCVDTGVINPSISTLREPDSFQSSS